MDLIPYEDIKPSNSFHSAPMIDFLFLMLSIFATIAVSRASLFDSEIQLAQLKPSVENNALMKQDNIQQINLSIDPKGSYKWITELQTHSMEGVISIQKELSRQYQMGVLSEDRNLTQILLHIDKLAPWSSVADLIFGIKELGFPVHPVYEPTDEAIKTVALE